MLSNKKRLLRYGIIIAFLQLCFLLSFLLLSPIKEINTVYANTTGLAYTLIDSNSAYSVSIGTATDSAIIIPASYNGKQVRRIADNGFSNKSFITSVLIPNSVTNIGASAFRYCNNLTSVNIPSYTTIIGNYAFQGTNITSINLPNTLQTLGSYSFTNTKLTSVVIPAYITTFGAGAFAECFSLTTVTLTNGLKTLGNSAFYYCHRITSITFPTSLTTIPNNAFEICSGLTSITFGTGVRTIGSYAFANISGLTSITIPNTVTSIGAYAFHNCSNLQTAVIGIGITSLPRGLFQSNSKLITVSLPDTLTAINEEVFYNCIALTNITIPRGVSLIKPLAFRGSKALVEIDVAALNPNFTAVDGVVYNKNITTLMLCPEGKTSVTIPETVTRIDSYGFYGCNLISEIALIEGIISLGSYSFQDTTALTNIILPSTLESIEAYAFYSCNGLTTIFIPSNVKTLGNGIFYNSSNLQIVEIDEGGVTVLPEYAFANCSKLENVVLSNDIVSIEARAFFNCVMLETITLPTYLESIKEFAFQGCTLMPTINIPSLVSLIATDAFRECTSLSQILVSPANETFKDINGVLHSKNGNTLLYSSENNKPVTISASVTSIGQYAFFRSKIENILIPDTVTSIGWYAFSNCTALTTVVIDTGITSIPISCFSSCTKLEIVHLPATLTNISDSAFISCTSLVSITLPDSITRIRDSAFYNCTKLESLVLPESLTRIDQSAFFNCNSLTSVIMKNNVTTVSMNAFYNCYSLQTIVLSESLQGISYQAFYNCNALTTVTLPTSVQYIDNYGFQNCRNLTTLHIKRVSPITNLYYGGIIGTHANLVIYVSALSINTYKESSYWLDYASKIITLEFVLSFETNGGSQIASVAKQFGEVLTAPNTPTRAGCSFAGWHTDTEFTQPYTFTTMPDQDIRLYAKWIVTITLNTEGNLRAEVLQVGKEFEYLSTQVLSKVGHTFLGWKVGQDIVNENTEFNYANGVTVIAAFQINTYSIVFETNGGEPIQPIVENYQTDVQNRATTPLRAGYNFINWYREPTFQTLYLFSTIPAQNTTIFAKWSPIVYTIVFDATGGEDLTITDKDVVFDDQVGSMPQPSRMGYTFQEWNTSEDGTGQQLNPEAPYQIPQDATLYAIWSANTYRIFFNSNGGISIATKIVHYDQLIGYLEDSVKLLNNFVGWKHQDTILTEDMLFQYTYDITVMAVWEPYNINAFVVIFWIVGAFAFLYVLTIPSRIKSRKIRNILANRKSTKI